MALTRRDVIQRSALLGLPLLARPRALEALALPSAPFRGNVVVNVFLRGGADGLNLVPPVAEGRYYDLRPTLAVPAPGSGEGAALPLDATFGLHPALAPLLPMWVDNSLAIVHATGSPSDSRSHFAAQDAMDRGRGGQTSDASGWLARHLSTHATGNTSPFRAVAIGTAVQKSLLGQVPALGIADVAGFTLAVAGAEVQRVRSAMAALFADPAALLDGTTALLFDAMDALGTGVPEPGEDYPTSSFGTGLRTLAQLIKADLGVEVASVDAGGWDTHAGEAAELQTRLADLAAGLTAFSADLGSDLGRVTVVVMTEFGRRAAENASAGTDHGHGSVMLALGAGVNGGRVWTDWPTLATDRLYGPGDLAVTTDFRLVLAEVLAARAGHPEVARVFPDWTVPAPPGIFRPGWEGPLVRRRLDRG
ncbi:MAG: DUF1501 domain-containing protein [Acidobacteriota bacterium]